VLSRNHVLVFLISLTLLALEMAWTRIFSAEFFYTFAFLVLSLAVLGLGLGALAMRLIPRLAKPANVAPLSLLAGLTALAGPPLVFWLELDFSAMFHTLAAAGLMLLAVVILNAPFFFGGAALALLFRNEHERITSLYMADLIGAGLGVAGIVLLMNSIGTPAATVWLVAPLMVTAFIAGRLPCRMVSVLLLVGMVFLAGQAPELLQKNREERAPVIYEHWDAEAKIKVYDFAPEYRGLNIDNVANSPLFAFDGNFNVPDSMKFEFGIDVSNLIERFDTCTFLSLGAGGGGDVLQALQAGATEVHAVEIIDHINHMMLEGEYAEFTGHIYDDPRVKVATADARSYVRRYTDKFDMIYSLSSNSWAAVASGSFALAENYLFTTEAFEDYWRALSPDGFMMMEHQFYMSRIATQVQTALDNSGVENPGDHFAIYALPSMRRQMVLISKQPLTDEIRNNAFGELTPEVAEHIHLLYPALPEHEDNLINHILHDGWQAWQDSTATDLSPGFDDRPFVAQLGLWKNFSFDKLEKVSPFEISGFPLAKLLMVVILLVTLVLILPLNLLPFITKGARPGLVPWLYFLCIGSGYMMLEVVLIQRSTLFLGTPLVSLVTVLMTMLLASGLGSWQANRFKPAHVFGAVVGLLLVMVFAWPPATTALAGLPLAMRVAVSVLFLGPLAFFMGMPFPMAARRVGEFVDWGFAIGGAGAVAGSTLAILTSFVLGFQMALLAGGLVYVSAAVLMSARRHW